MDSISNSRPEMISKLPLSHSSQTKAGSVMVHWVSQSLHRAITEISSMRSSAPEREGASLAMISKQKRRLEGLRVKD